MTALLLDPRRTVVFAGDSVIDCGRRTDPDGLGAGYVRCLYDDLAERRPRIVNAGISSNRAVDLVRRWSTDVLEHEPALVSILIGINDPKLEVVRKLAVEYGAVLVSADVQLNRLAKTAGAATLADDGVHPTAAGHRAIADLWRQVVLEH